MNDLNDTIQTIAVYALPVVFAITLHEAAHAYAAKYFGDTTAYAQGRMSLNPFKHIDPIGTILMPILIYISSFGTFLFGYAKPVPINYGALRKPKRDMAWVALAGPAANFVMAFGWILFSILLALADVKEDFFMQMARAGVLSNLVMFAFNLLPLPPLDGGRILYSILPNKLAYQFGRIEPYGFYILLGLLMLNSYLHVLDYWMGPVMSGAEMALRLFVSPLYLFLN
jgi:Zn-dependent protease